MATSIETLKKVACAAIDKAAEDLNALSQDIWNHPELCFEEKYSHDALCNFLEKYGFPVERHCVVDTAFRATAGETKVSFVENTGLSTFKSTYLGSQQNYILYNTLY